ncbi:MAG: DUF4830 domain-containing protein [Clostridiales bacterium]|mgnify:CR=1 FL=1|jgi:hypothetical protein|nr:DUF4830 domain-containing protein [Clostridiales bacterium]
MFICTLKWNKKFALLIIIAAAVVLCALILSIGKGNNSNSAAIAKVKTNEDRVKFLENLGWEVDSEPIEEKNVVIPKKFSDVYETYNRLQLEQGYDLSKYCGLETTIYTYSVRNYSGYIGEVVADLYVLNYEVIGGDIHSRALDGFMHGLCKK